MAWDTKREELMCPVVIQSMVLFEEVKSLQLQKHYFFKYSLSCFISDVIRYLNQKKIQTDSYFSTKNINLDSVFKT